MVLRHNLYFRNESLSSTQSLEEFNGLLNIMLIWADNHSVCVSKGIITFWDKRIAKSPNKIELCFTALCTRAIRSMIKLILAFPVVDTSLTEESTSSSCINLILPVLFILPLGFARDNGTGPCSYVGIFLRSKVRDIASLWNTFLS